MLREMKNVSIADVKDGAPARITGRVGVLDETLTSPVGERPCVAFRLEIATLAQGRQQIVLRRDEHRAFAVADQSGQATIEGTVLVGLDWEHDWSALPPRYYDMLEAASVEMEGAFFRRRFAYRQALIEAGDRVSACSLAFFEPDPTAPA